MKNQFIIFVIGVLLGAVIATGAFYVYTTTNCTNKCATSTQMNGGGTPPEMPSGQNSENGEPPAKPGENSTNTTESNS